MRSMGNMLSGSPFRLVMRVLSVLSLTALAGCETTGMEPLLADNYEKYLNLSHYRAFSSTPGSPGGADVVGWHSGQYTVEDAIKKSLEWCERGAAQHGATQFCRLHSVGDINVSQMTKEQRDRAIRVYKSNVLATNKDVQGEVKEQTRTAEPATPVTSIKGILRAKGLSDLEAFQEAKNYIGTKCLDNFERHEERHSSGLATAFAYAQERIGGRYACGGGYSMILAERGVESAKDYALGRCERAREKHGVNAPCEILAIGNKIVWEGETVRSK